MKHIRAVIFPLLCAFTVIMPSVSLAQTTNRLAWWRAARFGMFIHWGPVSLTGQEISWSRANSNTNCPNHGPIPVDLYDNLYKRFDPTNFHAGTWVDIAQAAGMKYMVLTAKHGDGFLLWNSKVDGYNIGATPFHRDVCAELAAAAHARHEGLGWYFSPMDWRDPDCRSVNNDRFVTKIQAEVGELLGNYGKIDVLWFDTDGRPTMWHPDETYALVRGLQPRILIDNRLDMGTWDQWAHQGKLNANEDFYTPEQRIGAYDDRAPWETCMTIGTQWAWKPNDQIKTAAEVIATLAQCAGGDGNLLLDVGPMPDGRLEPRQVEVLQQVGAWLKVNGNSIYSTRGGPWKPTKALTSTRRGNTIYLHVLRTPKAAIELPDFGRRIKSASPLHGEKIAFSQHDGKIFLALPPAVSNTGDTVVKIKLDGSAMDIPALEIPSEIKSSASNVYESDDSEFGPQMAFDENSETRWATDDGTKQAWITAEFPQPKRIQGVRIQEAYAGRVQKFEFQFRGDGDWQTIFSGGMLGENFSRTFPAVTARSFRLNILDATNGPTITEIELESE